MKFEYGLNPEIKSAVSTMEIRNYALLVNKCKVTEQNLNDLAAEHQNKRKREEDKKWFMQPWFQKTKNGPLSRS